VAHARQPDAAERHALDEKVNIHLIQRAAPIRKATDEPIDVVLAAR
jgi:hypothetical protein